MLGNKSAENKKFEKNPLDEELNLIARDLVESLGYIGAMVAVYEQGDALPIRARYIDPSILSAQKIQEWETKIQSLDKTNSRLNITNPIVYLHQPDFKDNISAKAAEKGRYIVSNDLFDLFTPFIPENIVMEIQSSLKIKQIIAMPFFIDGEYVGNLFIASKKDFSKTNIHVLNAFTHCAASSIRSERRRLQAESNQKLILDMQRNISSEEKILDRIVRGVVENFGYAGAMVAPYELGDALPVRATYLHPSIGSMKTIEEWEQKVQSINPTPYQISITNPDVARVYLKQEKYKNNLSVKAANQRAPAVSNHLFDLFTPIVPDILRPVIEVIQKNLKIKQVIAVPFSIDGDYYGNLFAATHSKKFSNWEIELLQSFGQNAAAGLRNAKIYKQSEGRREAAQSFGRMAFTAATSLHAFRGHIGALKMASNMFELRSDANERTKYYLDVIKKRTDQISAILDNLHTPWVIHQSSDVNINSCINRALEKAFSQSTWDIQEQVNVKYEDDLPSIKTSQEMLTEAFRNLIINAIDSIDENTKGLLVIESRKSKLNPKFIEVMIQDNGIGIKPENYSKVFELKWMTKSSGLEFGLFWTKDYIEGLGGSINFESQAREGTTFLVTLPV